MNYFFGLRLYYLKGFVNIGVLIYLLVNIIQFVILQKFGFKKIGERFSVECFVGMCREV